MTLEEFGGLLEGVCKDSFHFEAKGASFPRVIYAETGRDYEWAGNRIIRKTNKVDVHFYTQTEFDPTMDALEDLFAENNIPFTLEYMEYGRDADGNGDVLHILFKCEV